jgi:DNA polymerase-3 subunit beta
MTATLTRLAFTADAKALAGAVAWAAKRIPAKPAPPVLGGILLRVNDKALTCSGFDYDVAAGASLTVDAGSPGTVLVSGRMFAALTATLPGKPATVTADDTALHLRCAGVKLSFPLMVVEDYPTLPDAPAAVATVDAQEFAALAKRVVVAADLRGDVAIPALTGVYLKFGGGITAMASNRYRGAVGSIGWVPAPGDTADGGVLVPGEVLVELARATDAPGELAIGLSGGLVSFTGLGRSIVARTLDLEHFPTNLPDLIPPRSEDPTVVEVASLLAAVKRAAMVLEPKEPVRLRFEDGTVTVAGTGPHADAGEELACAHTGPAREITINPGYLADGLGALGTATAELTLPPNDRKPVLITAPGDASYRYFAMPIRK